MKINEVLGLGLPIRVKLNENFQLDGSVDPQTIIQINNCQLDSDWDEEECYKLYVTLLSDDMPHNVSVAKPDWYDKGGKPTWNYFEANQGEKQPNGDYKTIIFVMRDEDVFELVEKKENVIDLILVELRKQIEIQSSNITHPDSNDWECIGRTNRVVGIEKAIEIVERYKNKKS